MIKLLDDTEWEKEDLIKRMDDDSFYYGYLGEVALSSSSVKSLYESPVKYKNYLTKDDNNIPALREGRLFHTMLLEYQKLPEKYIFVDASSRNTNKYKDGNYVRKGTQVNVLSYKVY